MSSAAVEIVVVRGEMTAVVRQQAPLSMLSTVLMPAFDAVFEHLAGAGVQPGKRVIVYRGIETGMVDMEIGVVLSQPVKGGGDVVLSQTPGGRAALLRHTGPYDDLPDAHAAVQDWIDASPHRYGGAAWELYGEWMEDPQALVTDVYYLLDGRGETP